jgi:peptidoglycan DL-endopeptidase CwlO
MQVRTLAESHMRLDQDQSLQRRIGTIRNIALRHSLRRTAGALAAAVMVLTTSIVGDVKADPAADALVRLDELSRQALQSREAVTLAQRDADARLAAQAAAEDRHRADLAALDAANSQLAPHQAAADRVAAMTYVSGRRGQWAGLLTAGSPQQLLDQLSLQRTVAAVTADQVKAFQMARERAAAAARASETSAAVPPPAAAVDIPEALPVGVASEAGLQPNTIVAARAVSQRFPQIADIDGVRPDSKPWHPSGLAIDIMIPNPESPEGIALGDEILAFAMANAGRFGLQDVIWRGTYYTPAGPQGSGYGHHDHVHITTTPRR